jgi:acyl-CoA reductase-like NAD-dependent aldehyde dehydrogenase
MIAVRNPYTGQVDEWLAPPDASAVAATATRLRAAQPAWQALGLEGRIQALLRLADAITGHAHAIAAALECDTGRRRIARMEVDGVVASIRGWAGVAPGLLPDGWVQGRANPAIRHAPHWVPYGLVGVISPWNFPLTLSLIDAIPALLAGCAVMIKPSEVTPRFAAPLAAAVQAAGLADLLALLPGDGVTGQAMVDQVDCVCFTGSVATGRKVAVQAASRLIPAFLELGGKDPLIVLADADLDAAVNAALRGSVLATGQACQSIERIYVARPLYQPFLERLVAAAKAVRLNWPDINQGELGPIIFARQAEILQAQIDDARAKGAQVLTGGQVEAHGGLWLRPTVLTGIRDDMRVMQEETFGPLLPVIPFDTEDEAVSLANGGDYGLSAAVFAGDLDRAAALGRRLVAGAVSLNDAALTALFHEAPKQSFRASGLGPSRMGADGFTRFFRRQALIAQTGQPLPLAAFAEG